MLWTHQYHIATCSYDIIYLVTPYVYGSQGIATSSGLGATLYLVDPNNFSRLSSPFVLILFIFYCALVL
jgi:hypothetical protein